MKEEMQNTFSTKTQRYFPSIKVGLLDEQVKEREQNKLTNKTQVRTGKSYWDIIVSNILSFFNIFLVIIIILEIIAGHFEDIIAFLVVMSLNITLGLIQDIRAKKMLEKLNLTTAPTMMVIRNSKTLEISTDEAVLDDIFILDSGKQICVDAIIKDGTIEVDESVVTGESLSVKKTVGDEILSGSFVISGHAIAQTERIGKASFSEQIKSTAKEFKRPKSEILKSLNSIFRVISYFILPLAFVLFFTNYWTATGETLIRIKAAIRSTSASLIGMIPAGMLLFTTMTLAVGVIRLGNKKTMVQELYSIEMLARSTTLCFDKTGTLTDGTMSVCNVKVMDKYKKKNIKTIIGNLLNATKDSNQTAIALIKEFGIDSSFKIKEILPFSSSRKFSAATFAWEGTYIIGALEFITSDVDEEIKNYLESEAKKGYRVLALCHTMRSIKKDKIPAKSNVFALISIKDNVRANAKETIQWFKKNNVNIKIISGDNPITVSEIARQCGVDNYDQVVNLDGMTDEEVKQAALTKTIFGRVKPKQKALIVEALKEHGETVAMTGDGVNDIVALKCADCSIAMNSGADATKHASHLVLTDSDFSHMPEIVYEGRRVVNNLQQTCSLFLTKTVFAVLISFIFLIASLCAGAGSDVTYPFLPQNLYIWEFAGIGAASFFLSLQPNKDTIKGNFINNVISDAIPGGFSIALAVLMVFILKANPITGNTIPNDEVVRTMSMIIMSVMCFIVLLRCCIPFNKYRLILYMVIFIMTSMVFVILNLVPIYINGTKINIFQIYLNELTWVNCLEITIIVLVFSGLYFLLCFVFKNYITFKKKVFKSDKN